MIETSKQSSVRILALVALALSACNPDAAGQIPCVEDVSCPNDYPVCGPAGKCIAGTSSANASVAIVGAEGHAAADFLSGTVRVLVSARAATGVQSVTLASGSATFAASATAAAPPLFAFDVNTTALANGDAPLTATLTAGDGTTGTASGTLHVDNAKPVITSFSVAGGATAGTITSGKTIALTASFTGGTGTITAGAAGSISLTSGASVLVSPDVQTTYKLTVTSRSGVTASSGVSPNPDVTVSVVAPTAFTGSATVAPSAIQQGPGSGNFTFTAPAFGASVIAADVKDSTGAVVATIAGSGGTAQVAVPDTAPGTTQLTFTVVLRNGATVPDAVSFPLVVLVGSPPVITAFTGPATITSGASASLQATFVGGNGIITPGSIPILSGGTVIVAPTSTTPYKLTVTNPATSASVSSGSTPPDVTVTVVAPPVVNSFAASSGHATSGDPLTFSIGTTGVTGNAPVTGSCSPAATVPGFTINLTAGSGTSAVQAAPAVSATTTCTYTATVLNAAGASDIARAVVTVEPPPTIASFQFQSTATQAAFFALHSDVVLAHTYDAHGGTATINGVAAGAATTTFTNLRITTTYTLTVTNLAGKSVSLPATATVAPGSWSALNDTPIDIRRGATVTGLDDGTVLVAGGLSGSGAPQNTALLCDATGACTSIPMGPGTPVARAFHTAVKLANGKVLVAGGYTASGPATPTDTVVLFDPATRTFSSLATNLTSPRALQVAVLLSGTTVLIAGGTSGATPTNDLQTAMKYDASGPTATATNNNMGQKRANFTGTRLNSGKVLIVGGKTGDVTAELFDPAGGGGTGTFSTITPQLPTNEDKRNHTAVLLDGASLFGQVLISGGTTTLANGPSNTQFLFDPAGSGGNGTFTAAPSLVTSRSNHAAVILTSHSVLLCGGTSNGSNTLSSCERYDPLLGTLGTMFPTAPMVETIGRKDFGMAPMQNGTATPPALVQIFAAGGEPSTPEFWAEAYDSN
jgi:hypothetical protein